MSETPMVDLNAAFGKALLQQFFEPVLSGRGPNGEAYYIPSGVSQMAAEIYKQQAARILEEVWERIDMDDLVTKIAQQVTAELARVPTTYKPNPYQAELAKRVREIAAQTLGQRVVDQLDLTLGPKAIEEGQ